MLQPVAGDGRDGAVAPLGAGVGQRPELLEGVGAVGHPRRHHPPQRNPPAAALGDVRGGGERVGTVGEAVGQVVRVAKPRRRRRGSGAAGRGGRLIKRRKRRVLADGHQQPVAGPVFGVGKGDGVGGHDGKVEASCGGEDAMALAPWHQLGVEIGRAAQ